MPPATTTPGFLSMGKATLQVSQEALFQTNRSHLLKSLKTKLNGDATANTTTTIVYLQGGLNPERNDTDHEPIFRQESYFWYLTGVKEPDCAVTIDVATGKVTLFVPHLPADYATVMGRIRTNEEWKEHYQVDSVEYSENTDAVLLADNVKKLFLMKGRNSDSGNMYQPPTAILESKALLGADCVMDIETLFPILAECRVIKSPAELVLLQHVTEVTSFAHAYVMRNIKPDSMEYQGESLFRHYCYYNYGCRMVGYTPICGCGPNAAILHYGHAGEPNDRQLDESDICLFDLGAEYQCYGSDITCSFPASGKFSDRQKLIYEGVLQAQVDVYDMLKPGVSWRDCHYKAEATILKTLSSMGLVAPGDKSIDELVEMRLGAVFMPCGLGHFIGIDTHDVGGYLPGHPERIQKPGLGKLRTARLMKENMVVTVEPGIYFIDHLLDGALAEGSPLKGYLNEELVNGFRGFGGVRLEDVLAITSTGCVNYTLCPRTVEEVEHAMSGGKWPPMKDAAPELRRKRLLDPNPLPSPPSL